jgi:hypothetical protein
MRACLLTAYDLLTETLLVRRIHTSCVCLLNTKATAGGSVEVLGSRFAGRGQKRDA